MTAINTDLIRKYAASLKKQRRDLMAQSEQIGSSILRLSEFSGLEDSLYKLHLLEKKINEQCFLIGQLERVLELAANEYEKTENTVCSIIEEERLTADTLRAITSNSLDIPKIIDIL